MYSLLNLVKLATTLLLKEMQTIIFHDEQINLLSLPHKYKLLMMKTHFPNYLAINHTILAAITNASDDFI